MPFRSHVLATTAAALSLALLIVAPTARAADPLPAGGSEISYVLPQAAKVSLNIIDEKGQIVRELLRGNQEEAGPHTAHWDGNDNFGRPLPPGQYSWKVLHHNGIKADYVLSVANSGQPPYRTNDDKGSWGACHGNPLSVRADATGLYLTWYTEEGNAVFAHTDYDGRALYKIHNSQGWGRNDDAALVGNTLYRLESGPTGSFILNFDATTGKYVDWATQGGAISKGKLRIEKEARVVPDKNAPKDKDPNAKPPSFFDAKALAANTEYVAASFPNLNKIALFRPTGEALPDLQTEAPRGMLFLPDGRLLVAVPGKVLAYNLKDRTSSPFITANLDTPWGIALAHDGNSLWITDQGKSHQVKQFSMKGELLKTLGKSGGMGEGTVDHNSFYNPRGIACGTDGNLYVTEDSGLRRITRWSPDGKLLREWFGPLGPQRSCWPNAADFTEVYYHSPDGLIKCKVDLEKKTWQPVAWWRSFDKETFRCQPQAFESHGQKFLYTDNAALYVYDNKGDTWRKAVSFDNAGDKKSAELWTDLNNNGTRDEGETQSLPVDTLKEKNGISSVRISFPTFDPATMSFTAVCANDLARFEPARFTEQGLPVYSFEKIRRLTKESAQGPDRWCEILLYAVHGAVPTPDGGFITIYNGGRQGRQRFWDRATWNYVVKFGADGRMQWQAGVHGRNKKRAANEDEMFMRIAGISNGIIFVTEVESNFTMYTTDGLYIGYLMDGDKNLTPNSLCVENIVGLIADHPTTHETYLFSGSTEDARIWKLSGFDKLQRIEGKLTLKTAAAATSPLAGGVATPDTYIIAPTKPARKAEPNDIGADGFLTEPEWANAQALPITEEGTLKARLYLRTDDLYLWVGADVPDSSPAANNAQDFETAFTRGDAVDLYFGANPLVGTKRGDAGIGDVRVLLYPNNTRKFDNGAIVLYRNKLAPDAGGELKKPFEFTSPVGSVTLESVRLVEGRDTTASGGKGSLCTFYRWPNGKGYTLEAKIPLKDLPELGLGLDGKGPAHKIAFDAGIISSNEGGNDRASRLYWHQHDARTDSVVDLPNEAQFYPELWGNATIGGP